MVEYFKEELFSINGDLIKRAYYRLVNGKMALYNVDLEIDPNNISAIFGSSEPDHWVDEYRHQDEEEDEDFHNLTKTDEGYYKEIERYGLRDDWELAGYDGEYDTLEKYYYNSKKRLIKHQMFIVHSDQTLDYLWEEEEYEYDDYGNMTYYNQLYNEQKGLDNLFIKYKWEKFMLNTGKELFLLKSTNQDDFFIIEYDYDTYGEIISEVKKYKNKEGKFEESKVLTFEFEYDNKGRWVEKNVYEDQKLKSKYKREYGDFSNMFPYYNEDDPNDHPDLPF